GDGVRTPRAHLVDDCRGVPDEPRPLDDLSGQPLTDVHRLGHPPEEGVVGEVDRSPVRHFDGSKLPRAVPGVDPDAVAFASVLYLPRQPPVAIPLVLGITLA